MSASPVLRHLESVTPSAAPERGSPLDFALRVGHALHLHGAPAHRLEDALTALCQRLGLTASFFSTPTALFVSVETGAAPEVHLLRVQGSTVDLGMLADLDALSSRVARGELTAREGLACIDALEAAPPAHPRRLLALSYGVNSAAACCFLGGGWKEVAGALLVGLVTGGLSLLSSRGGSFWRAFEPTAAFCAALVGTFAAALVGGLSLHVTVLAGLIALLPGYTLTVAIAELANRHLSSGSARLTAAGMSFLGIGFGVALGNRVAEWLLGPVSPVAPTALPVWGSLLALPIAAISFAVLFRARSRDLPAILAATIAGIAGARVGATWLGPELGSFLGAFAATLLANAYARRCDRPAVVPLFPALMLLVPGSVGFRSFASLLAQDVVSGVQTAFQMLLVAVALVAGLLVANDVLPSRRAL